MKKYFTLLYLIAVTTFAQGQVPVIQYQPVVAGLSEPLDVVHAKDGSGRLFIVQQGGLIRIWDGSALLPVPFLNVSNKIIFGGERGLLSIAFHPDYKNNRYFFVYYTRAVTGALTIERYRTLDNNANVADPNSGVEILSIPHSTNANHNGGKLNFGMDGYLYLGTGDGGSSNDPPNNAQTGTSLLGKMLRIDVNNFADVTPPLYAIPPTNPYITDANVNNEIIALGLRNPFRWSFDSNTGDMWIGDVGQGAREEVDVRIAAAINTPTNYGWRCLEGFIPNPSPAAVCPVPPNYVAPIFDYTHDANTGGFVITGGIVYRGTEYPSLYGYYITTDYATGNIWLIKQVPGSGYSATLQTANKVIHIAGFGTAENETLYAVRLNDGVSGNTGVLYKIVTETILPIRIISFTGKMQDNMHYLQWNISGTSTGDRVVVEREEKNENKFTEIYSSPATGLSNNNGIKIQPVDNNSLYRLKIVTNNGAIIYSTVVSLHTMDVDKISFNTWVAGDYIRLDLGDPANFVELYDGTGKLHYKNDLSGRLGVIQIPIGNLAKGVYYLRVYSGKNSLVKKLSW